MLPTVDLVAKHLTVRRNIWKGHVGTPKNGKERTIPLNANAVVALKAQRHLRGQWVWCHEDGSHFDNYNLKWALRRIRKRSGLRHFEWHVLRHSFGSHLVMRGVPLKVVMELMGHSTIEMTMRYAHLSPDVPRDAVEVLVGDQQFYGKMTANKAL